MDHVSGSSGGHTPDLIHSTSSLANKQPLGAAGSSSASAVTAPTVDTNTPVVAGHHPALGANFWKSVAVGTGASASVTHGKQAADAAPMSKLFTRSEFDAVGKALDRLQCDFSCSWTTPIKTNRWDLKRSGNGWTATGPDPKKNWTVETSPSELLSTVAYDIRVEIPAAHVQAFEAALAAEVGPDAPSVNNASMASMLSRHGIDATGEELKSFLESVSAPGAAHEALPLDLLKLYIDNHRGDSVDVNVSTWNKMPWGTDSSECIVAYSDDDGRPCYLEFDQHWTVKMPGHADRSLGVNGVYVDIGGRLTDAMVKKLGKNGPVTVLHLLPKSAGRVQSTTSAVAAPSVQQSRHEKRASEALSAPPPKQKKSRTSKHTAVSASSAASASSSSVRQSRRLPLTMSANENDSLMPRKNLRDWTSHLDLNTAAFGKFLDYLEAKLPGQPLGQLPYRDFMHWRHTYINEKMTATQRQNAQAALSDAAVELYGHTWMLTALAERGRHNSIIIWKGLEFETHLMNLNPPLSCATIKENPGAHKDAFFDYRNDPGNNQAIVRSMLAEFEPHLEISALSGMPILQPSNLDTRLPLQGTAHDNDNTTADLTAYMSASGPSTIRNTRNRHAAAFLKYVETKDKNSGPTTAYPYHRFVKLRAAYLKDKGNETELLRMFSEMAAKHYPDTWGVRSSLRSTQQSMTAYLDFDAHLMTRMPSPTSLAGLAEAGDNNKQSFFDLYGVTWAGPRHISHLATVRQDCGIALDSLRMLDALRVDMPIVEQYVKGYIVHFEPMLQQEGIDLADPRLGTPDDGSDRRRLQIEAFERAQKRMLSQFPELKLAIRNWIENLQVRLFP
jgi:hypothetical protein